MSTKLAKLKLIDLNSKEISIILFCVGFIIIICYVPVYIF
jgi:hypothetical protein